MARRPAEPTPRRRGGRRRQASLWHLFLGFLGVLATIAFMSVVSQPWRLAVFALGLAILGYMAAVYGYDSRDGRDW